MNRIYHVICLILVLFLLVMGCISLFDRDATVSVVQDRQLKTFPEFRFTDILKGAFLEKVEEYYSDTFPGREALLEKDGIVSKFFDFSGLRLGETE